MSTTTQETHACPHCGRDFPLSSFPPRATRGWVGSDGVRRSGHCAECVRAISRESHRRQQERRHGSLLAGYGLVDAAPFRKWLEDRRRVFLAEARHDANGRVIDWSEGRPAPTWFSSYVGVPERHLYRILVGEMKRVRVDIVDQALVHEGSTMLWELYPELYPDLEIQA